MSGGVGATTSRVVPVEPTRGMWAAGADAIVGYKNRHHDKVVADVWRAMLAAAPTEIDVFADISIEELAAFRLGDPSSIESAITRLGRPRSEDRFPTVSYADATAGRPAGETTSPQIKGESS